MNNIEILKDYIDTQGAIKQDLKPHMPENSESYFIDYGATQVIVTITEHDIDIELIKGDKAISYTEPLGIFNLLVVSIDYWYHYIVDDLRAKLWEAQNGSK